MFQQCRLEGQAGAGLVFSGDVLFEQGIGRTDLPGGDYATLMRSLREVRLPRSVRLEYPRPAKELPDTWHIRPMLSAMIGMEAVAYIRFTDQIIPHAVWITDVVVGRPLRRQGLARKLMGAAEAWGVQRGLRRAVIEVQSKNQPAIRMILKMGFEFCGYNDQYYATRDVALFFVRSL